jgi:uncharacterized membrane protein
VKKLRSSFYHFAWNIHDGKRAVLCGSFGVLVTAILFRRLGWEIASILGWICWVGSYLLLLGIVIVSADGSRTQQRVSRDNPNTLVLLILLVVTTFISNIFVGIILTSVGNRTHGHTQVLIVLSAIAILLSWCLLHTSFGQQYARIYYDVVDDIGRTSSGRLRRGLAFPGTDQPAYLDFLYVSFTIALTYATSDVDIESEYLRRIVLVHSLVSFFFYSIILGSVLNAIVTS